MFGKKVISLLAAGMMLISLASCGESDSGSSKSSNATIEKPIALTVEAVNECDVDKYIQSYVPEFAKVLEEQVDQSSFEDMVEAYYDGTNDLSYTIVSKERLTGDDLVDLQDEVNEMAESFDCDTYEIEDAYEIEFELEWDGETETQTTPVVLVNGVWYFAY